MLAEFMKPGEVGREVDEFLKDFDPHATFFRDHFLNIATTIAERAPILRSEKYGGFTVVSSHALMREMTTDTSHFLNTARATGVPETPLPRMVPKDANPPEHAIYRAVLNPLFTSSRIARRKDAVDRLARDLLSNLLTRKRFDIIKDYAKPLTGVTSFKMFGLDPESWADYDTPIHNSTFQIGSLEDRGKGFQEYQERVKTAVANAVKDPDPETVIGAMALYEQDGRTFSEDEICQAINNLIIGGLGTTQAVTGTASVFLGRNPNRRQELIDHPERMANACNEFIRIFSSAPITGREVAEDIEIAGQQLRAGETALMFWAAGNFDPAFIDRPLEVDFQRQSSRMSTFAIGPHMCLGQYLARAELSSLLTALLELAPNYKLIEEEIIPASDVQFAMAYLQIPVTANVKS